ncbi:DegV family protein [Hominiventricola aquisgranensis]|uniref:DegV family protein n=1 Tax=Hominiventricola aquisgranensis TaxID=3133164 RepID=A0ABV1HX36_9FIRM
MNYRIVVDSCGEFTEDMKKNPHFVHAALHLSIDGEQFVDDETFDRLDFLAKMKESPNCPKSSCPSPEVYRAAFDCGAEHLYAITLSAELSGSYNSAVLGMNLFLENHPDAKVHVFNSCSASVGETLIAKKIAEYEEAGLDFEAIIEKVDDFILHMHTYFVLESLDNLRKNGRLSAVKALVATALNIKPVMGATDQGVIIQLGQARGMQKALRLMAETITAELEHPEEKVLGLVHCNNPERAEYVKQELMKLVKVKDIIVLESSGVSTLYAAQGGIIIAV